MLMLRNANAKQSNPNTKHNCLEELVGPMNCSRYMAGTLVKSTLKLTRIHQKLNDLSMAFFKNDRFAVFLSKIEGKMGRK